MKASLVKPASAKLKAETPVLPINCLPQTHKSNCQLTRMNSALFAHIIYPLNSTKFWRKIDAGKKIRKNQSNYIWLKIDSHCPMSICFVVLNVHHGIKAFSNHLRSTFESSEPAILKASKLMAIRFDSRDCE